MEPITLKKPVLLAKGTKMPICPQCESPLMCRKKKYDDYRCYNCHLEAIDAMVFRIKEDQQ